MPSDPNRFQVSRLVLLIDRVMNRIITFGGISLIVLVLGIFVFIGLQIYPLFLSAKVAEAPTRQAPAAPPAQAAALSVDEYGSLPLLISSAGVVSSLDESANSWKTLEPGLPADFTISATSFRSDRLEGVWGSSDGRISLWNASFTTENLPGGKRVTTAGLKSSTPVEVGQPGLPVSLVAAGLTESEKLVATLQNKDGKPILKAALIVEKRGLGGRVRVSVDETWDLSQFLQATPVRLIALAGAKQILAVLPDGRVQYFSRLRGPLEPVQTFQPFGDLAEKAISQAMPLFGDVSLVFANTAGANRIYSLYEQPDPSGAKAPNGRPLLRRLWGQTKELPDLGGPVQAGAVSVRNKCFLVASGNHVSLRHATSETVRWETDLPFEPVLAAIGPKYDLILFLDKQGALHRFSLHDPHPEAGFKAYFTKVWYEGQSESKYEWQSTGGSDEFEPKLSLVPLIFGTLKATFYAMVFSVPLALLSAVYVSQFTHPTTRRVVKPVMEVMASLPSVVLGFLAALILAPMVEKKVPSMLLSLFAVPLAALVMALVANSLPTRQRNWMRQGREWWLILPALVLAAFTAWQLGPWVEQAALGGDFRQWWASHVGDFQQRNSMIVGFAMGFAVIPIIFTIAEDSLSNVPGTLRSASLALGASRWQTALRVVVPTASPGIFSAVMIGLGRAVGETMIVVMATGNTPIMEFNLFNGMRTLSANIAVELPEAAEHSTLARTLYLCAFLLFLMTFCVNTVAEVLRQRLREKYKTV